MKHSIEIRFDAKAEEAIRSIWASAATTYATTYVLRNGVIPHMALLVGDETIG